MPVYTEQKIPSELVQVLADGQIQVREATIVLSDGVEISRTYRRYVLAPGDDLTGKDAKLTAIANATWTPAVVSAYKAKAV